ncbi:MAG: CPBP family intramembrane metalloprotease [Candidatus Micrarchaeota archaeon]|nr:CPBP family intramembrane metalloprotease [Candidatus Micrarchaeota archaeon]
MASRRARGPSTRLRYSSYLISLILVAISAAIVVFYSYGGVSQQFAEANLSITTSLFFPSIVFSYLLYRKRTPGQIIGELGLSARGLTIRNLAIGVLIFLSILALAVAFGLISQDTGIQLPTNVGTLLSGMPLYFLVFASVVAPFNEEILFRGFLVGRIGVILSALLFAAPHYVGYSSVSEFAAALVFGLIAGLVFKRTKSLYPSILAHVLINVLAVISLSL